MTSWMRSKPGCPDPVTLEEHYQRAADLEVYVDSGICKHLPYLRSLVQPGDVVVELGMGGGDQSTLAWLAGKCSFLFCYDMNEPSSLRFLEVLAEEKKISFEFIQGDTTKVGTNTQIHPIPAVSDILFIDTLHDCATVEAELAIFALLCRRQIVFHDVVTFGRVGQFSGPNQGINLAIAEFLFEHPEWRVERLSREDNGLLTLRREGV